MKVTGFSFIKNAIKFQYPIEEALRSILPLCDEVIVAVGASEDGTRKLVATIDPKIKIIDTVWNESLKEGGYVLADETNKAFQAIRSDADWCIYIQGDEVMHEGGHNEVRNAMHKWKDDSRVDGLLFKYRHFYGSYDYVGISSRWYRSEIRVIKNNKSIYSYRDAQGFRKGNNEKLNVKPLNAYIHHYGWVREPEAMEAKSAAFGKLWMGDQWEPKMYGTFDYSAHIDALEKYKGTHPFVMRARIDKVNWKFEHDISFNKLKTKDKLKNLLEKLTGKRPFDHNNFKIV
ncbi:MAG: glycosyl transferase [Chitinophagaceae bacterium]